MFSHLVEDGFDVDRKVSVRAAEPSYDAEAQAWWASLQSNGLVHASTGEQNAKQCVSGPVCMHTLTVFVWISNVLCGSMWRIPELFIFCYQNERETIKNSFFTAGTHDEVLQCFTYLKSFQKKFVFHNQAK